MRLLLGELTPTAGSVRQGTNLSIGRFDQLHRSLDPDKTLQENVCPQGGDTVTVGDKSRHVMGYLGDFLFTPDQVRAPVRRLSGGERNRLQLACLLARPCNLLVMDEPTNDLDVETLELLEGLLLEFSGTLLLVSHDREFLDHAVTSLLIGASDGRWTEHVGGWTDWRETKQAAEGKQSAARESSRADKSPPARQDAANAGVRRLTFTERHELERLPARLEALEARKAAIEAEMSEPGFFAGPRARVAETTAQLEAVSAELDEAYARWEQLETIAESGRV